MELRHYAAIIWKWLWLIVLGALLASVATYLINSRATPVYRATSTLLISLGSGSENTSYSDLLSSERLARTYAERLASRSVLEETASRLGLGSEATDLDAEAIDVQFVRDTQLIRLSVSHQSPELAQAIANTLPELFGERNNAQQSARFADSKASLEAQLAETRTEVEKIQEELAEARAATPRDDAAVVRLEDRLTQLRGTQATLLQSYEQVRLAEATTQNALFIDEPAALPTVPISPRPLRNALLALIAGALGAMGIAFLIEYLDESLRTPDRVSAALGLPTMGFVGRIAAETGVVALTQPRSPLSEAYRVLRANLHFAAVGQPLRTILVSSASPQEGKSTTAANLAVVMAQAGQRVVLVDGDLRRPRQHHLFQLPNQAGLSTAIAQPEVNLEMLLKPTHIDNLWVLTSGPVPPNPSELLGSQRMIQVVQELLRRVDLVIFDSPPVLAVADAAVMAAASDITLLVVDASKTRERDARRAVEQLRQASANLVGVALNRVNPKSSGYYYSYYSTDSDDDSSSGTPGPQQAKPRRAGLIGSIRSSSRAD